MDSRQATQFREENQADHRSSAYLKRQVLKIHNIRLSLQRCDHGNRNVNIDYLVFGSGSSFDDKSALQAAIEKYSGLNKDDYAESLWNEFKKAYDDAVKGMNDDKTTKSRLISLRQT